MTRPNEKMHALGLLAQNVRASVRISYDISVVKAWDGKRLTFIQNLQNGIPFYYSLKIFLVLTIIVQIKLRNATNGKSIMWFLRGLRYFL